MTGFRDVSFMKITYGALNCTNPSSRRKVTAGWRLAVHVYFPPFLLFSANYTSTTTRYSRCFWFDRRQTAMPAKITAKWSYDHPKNCKNIRLALKWSEESIESIRTNFRATLYAQKLIFWWWRGGKSMLFKELSMALQKYWEAP